MVVGASASVRTTVCLIGSCNLGVRNGALIHIQEEGNFEEIGMQETRGASRNMSRISSVNQVRCIGFWKSHTLLCLGSAAKTKSTGFVIRNRSLSLGSMIY